MPRVPKIDELQVGMRGLDVREQRPVQARLSDTSPQGYDLSRLRQQSANNAGMPPVRGIQALRFSDEPSRQVAAAGAALAQWADVRRQIGIQQANELDRARVTDAQNQYMEAVLDAANNEQSGWKQRQGVAAMPDKTKQRSLDDEVFEKLNKRRTEIIDSLGNDRQKAAFAEYAAQEDFRQKQAIQAHVLQQSQQYKINSEEGGIAVAGKMIATAQSEQEREEAIAKLEQHIAGIGHLQGLEGDALQAARQQYAGQYVSAAINERINVGDLNGAGMMLERYRGYMDGITISRVNDVLRVAQENQLVNEVVQDYIGSGEVDFVAAKPGDPHAVYNHGFNAQTYLSKLVSTESGGKNKARPRNKDGTLRSTAYGRAQFTNDTWMLFGESEQGKALRGNMSKAEWLEMRSNKEVAEAATLWYAYENKRAMDRAGIPFNNLTAYLFHFGGPDGGRRLYEAHPDTPLTQVLSKGAQAANPELMQHKTAGGLVAYFAKKMGVKPTGEKAPQPKPKMSNAELEQYVYDVAKDNPTKAAAIRDVYKTRRDVEIEQEKAQRDNAYQKAYVAVHSREGFSSLDAETINLLTAQQIVDLTSTEEQLEERLQRRQNAANRVEVLKLSRDPEKLATMSESDIYQLEGQIGYENVKTLLTARDNIMKSDDNRKAYSLGKEVRESLINKAYGAKTIAKATSKEKKRELDNIRYFLQTEELTIINGLLAAGEEPTRERIMEELETALLEKKTVEVPGWLWGTNTESKYLATLEPWQQEQFRAAERLALKQQLGIAPQEVEGADYYDTDEDALFSEPDARPITKPNYDTQDYGIY